MTDLLIATPAGEGAEAPATKRWALRISIELEVTHVILLWVSSPDRRRPSGAS